MAIWHSACLGGRSARRRARGRWPCPAHASRRPHEASSPLRHCQGMRLARMVNTHDAIVAGLDRRMGQSTVICSPGSSVARRSALSGRCSRWPRSGWSRRSADRRPRHEHNAREARAASTAARVVTFDQTTSSRAACKVSRRPSRRHRPGRACWTAPFHPRRRP